MMLDVAAVERELRAALAQGRLGEVEAALRQLLASGSGPIPFWKLLSNTLRLQNRAQEALPIQEMIVRTVPGDLSARFDLSEILLLLGDFTRGWREYRYRYSLPHTTRIERKVQVPRWDGERMAGQTLLVHDEQGYGDTFQFLRLLAATKERSGGRLLLEVNHETLALAERSFAGVCDAIFPRGTLPPPFQRHCEMMSLPNALGLQLADLPGPMPYLLPDPARLDRWRARLAALPRPIVALAWAGRPTHHNDANRSMTLAQYAPLAMPGVSFVAIQKGPAAEQAKEPPAGMALTALSDEIADFDDTAAIFCLADLLVSVDSSPIHLAGALGRPAWVLLPFFPDWRWLLGRDDTPWYPGHRLYRQPQHGDYATPLARIAADLAALRDRGP